MRKTFGHPCWTAGTVGVLLFVAAIGTGTAQAPQPAQPAPPTQPAPAAPPKTNDSQAAALDLLRKVIAEQQKNPDKIIRLPPPTSPSPAPARESKASKASSASTGPRLSRAELERQFLEGKITAKQFQRAAEELERNPPPPPPPPPAPAPTVATEKSPAAAKDPAAPALSPKAVSALPGKVITNQPSAVATARPQAADEEPEQKALSDVEAKIDEILARRVAIAEAARTNAASTNAVPAGPLTKRQKLDGLLRQLIQGKITEQEYNTQREKIVAQPE